MDNGNTDNGERKNCARCGKKHLGTFVWLELNCMTGYYATPGRVPTADSQGLFPFGKTCAYRALGHERFDDDRLAHPERYVMVDGKWKAAADVRYAAIVARGRA